MGRVAGWFFKGEPPAAITRAKNPRGRLSRARQNSVDFGISLSRRKRSAPDRRTDWAETTVIALAFVVPGAQFLFAVRRTDACIHVEQNASRCARRARMRSSIAPYW